MYVFDLTLLNSSCVLNLITVNQNVISHSGDTRLSYNQLAHIQTNNWWIEVFSLRFFLLRYALHYERKDLLLDLFFNFPVTLKEISPTIYSCWKWWCESNNFDSNKISEFRRSGRWIMNY